MYDSTVANTLPPSLFMHVTREEGEPFYGAFLGDMNTAEYQQAKIETFLNSTFSQTYPACHTRQQDHTFHVRAASAGPSMQDTANYTIFDCQPRTSQSDFLVHQPQIPVVGSNHVCHSSFVVLHWGSHVNLAWAVHASWCLWPRTWSLGNASHCGRWSTLPWLEGQVPLPSSKSLSSSECNPNLHIDSPGSHTTAIRDHTWPTPGWTAAASI